MSKKWSSYKETQLITENWRRFLAEAERKGPYSGISYHGGEEIQSAHDSLKAQKMQAGGMAKHGLNPSGHPDWKRQAGLVNDALEAGEIDEAEKRLEVLHSLSWLLSVAGAQYMDVLPRGIRPAWGELDDLGADWGKLAAKWFNEALQGAVDRWKQMHFTGDEAEDRKSWEQFIKGSSEEFDNWGLTGRPSTVSADLMYSMADTAGGQGYDSLYNKWMKAYNSRNQSRRGLSEQDGPGRGEKPQGNPQRARATVGTALACLGTNDHGWRGTALTDGFGGNVLLLIQGGEYNSGRLGGATGQWGRKKLDDRQLQKQLSNLQGCGRLRRRDDNVKIADYAEFKKMKELGPPSWIYQIDFKYSFDREVGGYSQIYSKPKELE